MKTSLLVFLFLLLYTVLPAQIFEQLPGEGIDIAAGTNGTVWLVGTRNNVHQWNETNRSWSNITHGNARQIAVPSNGVVTVVEKDNSMSYRGANRWIKMSQSFARDITADAKGELLRVGTGNNGVADYERNNIWIETPSIEKNVKVVDRTTTNTSWVIQNDSKIAYYFRGGRKTLTNGTGIDLAISKASDATVYVIGARSKKLFQWDWTTKKWTPVPNSPSRLTKLTVDNQGRIWVLDEQQNIFRTAKIATRYEMVIEHFEIGSDYVAGDAEGNFFRSKIYGQVNLKASVEKVGGASQPKRDIFNRGIRVFDYPANAPFVLQAPTPGIGQGVVTLPSKVVNGQLKCTGNYCSRVRDKERVFEFSEADISAALNDPRNNKIFFEIEASISEKDVGFNDKFNNIDQNVTNLKEVIDEMDHTNGLFRGKISTTRNKKKLTIYYLIRPIF